jgi:hypothetical protein
MGSLESFLHLFRGRADAYGTWTGGCVHRRLTPAHFERHLYSHDPSEWIGVYNVIGTWASWGCVDIDVDNQRLAVAIRETLVANSIPAWVEQTTRGYHVWVFPFGTGRYNGVADARTLRRALRQACLAIGYTPKEVFPKQDSASGTTLGNYVRLPLNGSHANPPALEVRKFIHPGVTLQQMDIERAETIHLHALAAHCPPDPQVVDVPVDTEAGLEAEDEVYRMGGRAVALWRDGPRSGHDRSNTLHHLAYVMAEADIEPTTAWAVLVSADQRWGKFATRGSVGMAHLRKILDRAYGKVVA